MTLKKGRSFCPKTLPAFTIMEVGVAIFVIAILSFTGLKGIALIDKAKQQSTIEQFHHLRHMIHEYRSRYNQIPGDDPLAQQRFGQGPNGPGHIGRLQDVDPTLLWQHLYQGGIIANPQEIMPSMGGRFWLMTLETGGPLENAKGGDYIALTGVNHEAVLTPKQCLELKNRIDGGNSTLNEGAFSVINHPSAPPNSCVEGNRLKLTNDNKVCIGLLKLE